MFFDMQGVMQTTHVSKVHISPYAPAVFHGLVKEGFPFLGKREPSMDLSFQICWLKTYPLRKNSNSLSARFPINKNLTNQSVATVAVTFWGIYVTSWGITQRCGGAA